MRSGSPHPRVSRIIVLSVVRRVVYAREMYLFHTVPNRCCMFGFHRLYQVERRAALKRLHPRDMHFSHLVYSFRLLENFASSWSVEEQGVASTTGLTDSTVTAAEGPNPEGRVGTPSARGARHKKVSPSSL